MPRAARNLAMLPWGRSGCVLAMVFYFGVEYRRGYYRVLSIVAVILFIVRISVIFV